MAKSRPILRDSFEVPRPQVALAFDRNDLLSSKDLSPETKFLKKKMEECKE